MTAGAELLLSSPATIAPPFLGLWPLLGALLGLDAAAAAARVRAAHATRHLVVGSLLGYADAIIAGRGQARGGRSRVRRRGRADGTAGRVAQAIRQAGHRASGDRGRLGRPGWLAARGRRVLRRPRRRPDSRSLPGAAAPGRRAGAPAAPGKRRAARATAGTRDNGARGRRAAAGRQGLGNKEIAEAMFLSPRTVEKHVASLLAKTGLRRSQLAAYAAGLSWVSSALVSRGSAARRIGCSVPM